MCENENAHVILITIYNEVGWFWTGLRMRCDHVEIAGYSVHQLLQPCCPTLPCIRAVTETQHGAADVT